MKKIRLFLLIIFIIQVAGLSAQGRKYLKPNSHSSIRYDLEDARSYVSLTPSALLDGAFEVNYDFKSSSRQDDFLWLSFSGRYFNRNNDKDKNFDGFGASMAVKYYLDPKNKIYSGVFLSFNALQYADSALLDEQIASLNQIRSGITVGILCKIYKTVYVDFFGTMEYDFATAKSLTANLDKEQFRSYELTAPNYIGVNMRLGMRIGMIY